MPTVEVLLEVDQFNGYFLDEPQVKLTLVHLDFVVCHRLSAVVLQNLREEVLLLEAFLLDYLEDDFPDLINKLVGVITAKLLGVLKECSRSINGREHQDRVGVVNELDVLHGHFYQHQGHLVDVSHEGASLHQELL